VQVQKWGVTLVRVVTGLVFVMHGGQKVFFMGLHQAAAGFAKMGIPMPGIAGPLVALVELIGGICLILGIFTRWAAMLLALDMAGAIFFVHGRNGFFLPRGFEYAMVLLAVNLMLAVGGGGATWRQWRIWRR
jgi:putative oxidoreductase